MSASPREAHVKPDPAPSWAADRTQHLRQPRVPVNSGKSFKRHGVGGGGMGYLALLILTIASVPTCETMNQCHLYGIGSVANRADIVTMGINSSRLKQMPRDHVQG